MERWPTTPPDNAEMVTVGPPGLARALFRVSDGVWLMNGPDETEVDIVAMPAGGFAFLETTGGLARTGISDNWEELGRSLE
jgi:hypothetical protein